MSDASRTTVRVSAQLSRQRVWLAAAITLFAVANLFAFSQNPHPVSDERGFLRGLMYPIETNPADRLLTVQRDLTGVAKSAVGDRTIAVGDSGAIITSENGGQSWTTQDSGTASGLASVSTSADGQHAVAVGEGGTILVSGDGGKTWAPKASRTANILESVSLTADGKRAFAVGDGGVILSSVNGGENWKPNSSGTSVNLYTVSTSADGQHAVAVGDGGTILVTSNSGEKWTARSSGTLRTIYSVSLSADGQRAVAAGDSGVILTSTDGGKTWAPQSSGTNNRFFGVSLGTDGKRAIAVGSEGAILTSDDGGQIWKPVKSSSNRSLGAVSLSASGRSATVVGLSGAILNSDNGGQSWAALSSYVANMLSGVSLSANGRHAVVVGKGGAVLTSSDSGKSWVSRSSGIAKDLYDVSLSANGQSAIAIGDGGAILVSNDRGRTWVNSSFLKMPNIVLASNDVSNIFKSLIGISNQANRVAISADGRQAVAIWQGSAILVSTNGGQDWTLRASSSVNELRDVSLSANGRNAVAVGSNGYILASDDGGLNWKLQDSQTANWLTGVSIAGDGKQAVAVGQGNSIVARKTDGNSWEVLPTDVSTEPRHISISSNATRAIGVGPGGAIVTSNNGGTDWYPQTSGTVNTLEAVSLSPDGQRAVAVGNGGVILTSSDGGQVWQRGVIVKNGSRYPAPWYYLLILLCAFLLSRAFSGSAPAPQTGAAAMAASDSPTMSLNQDRLDFAPLARGISRFLRNTNTDAPLTLAITGEWGSGKSSLMGQICADLRANHWRPVSFNAWHHQNEEQLLAALLVAVRESGVPPIVSFSGIRFRMQLLLIRARQRWLAMLFVVTLAGLIIGFAAYHSDAAKWQGVAAMLNALKGNDGWPDLNALQSILPILSIIGVVVMIGRTIKAFGVDPAVLLSSTMAKFRLKDASAQTSFRMRFSKQFGEVTQALAFPMVIVIDDLDRCKPETVLDVMEAVNFLTTSGKCFVIFGMATQRVQAALALSFKEIAGELVQFDPKPATNGKAPSDEERERERRRDYARDYLEKLINIEILVPDRTDLPPSQLLEERDAVAYDPLAGLIAEVKRWWLVLPVGGALALGIWLASLMAFPEAPKQIELPTQVAKIEPKATIRQSPTVQAPRPTPTAPINQAPVLIPGDDRGISPLWFLLSFGTLSLIGAAFAFRWYQRQKLIVQDTQAFRDAVRIWTPIATFTRKSPRSIKRFGNRIRYLAMLQQGEQLDEQPLTQQLVNKVAGWLAKVSGLIKRRPAIDIATPTPVDEALALSEHRVVALGAMHARFGDDWRNCVENEAATDWPDLMSENPTGFSYLFRDAIESYRAIQGASWPPSDSELDAFERSLKGVRLPGDGRTLDASPVEQLLSPASSIDPDKVKK